MQVQFYKSAALPTELCGHKQARILGLTPPQSNLQQEEFSILLLRISGQDKTAD